MKKYIIAVLLTLLLTSNAWALPPLPPTIFKDTNCDQNKYKKFGVLCQDTDDGKLYKWSGAALVEITAASGTGDILDVWNCSVGDCQNLVADVTDSLDASNAASSKPFKSGVDGSKPGTCTEPMTYWATDTNKLYMCTATNTWTEYAGGGGASGKGYLWIPSGTMVPHDCSGLLQSDVDPNIIDYLAFDGVTSESAFFTLSQEDWDLSTIKAKFVWAPSSEDSGQTVQWCLRCYAVSDGDSYDVAFSAGEQCATADALGASDWASKNQKITAATSAITVQGTPAAGDVVHCQVYRNVAGDDYEHDAWLIGVKVEYTKTTPTAW